MAIIRINAEKDARCMQSVVQLRGDERSCIVRFYVDRYDSGVDLAGLIWTIKTKNANGVEDAFEPAAVETSETRIMVDWLLEGTVTEADGLTEYELNALGYDDAEKAVRWKGGKGTVSVRKSYPANFGENADGFSNIEKLIIYVNGELQEIIEAGDNAAAAAAEATDAATTATAAASIANNAANSASTAATAANTAAPLATAAAAKAEEAAEAANAAAERADASTDAVIRTSVEQELTPAEKIQAQKNIGLLAVIRNLTNAVEKTGNPVQAELVGGMPFDEVTTTLEPVQAGSGDPYPAGGGKNLIDSELVQGTRGTSGVLFTGTTYTAVTIENPVPVIPGMIVYVNTSIGALGGVYRYYLYDADEQFISTEGGIAYNAGVTIPDGAAYFAFQYAGTDYANYIGTRVMLTDGEFAEYAPYSNIRPITGFTGAGLTRCGKNLLKNTATTQTVSGVTVTVNADGSVTVNGTAMTNVYLSLGNITLSAGSYILSGGSGSGSVFVYTTIDGTTKADYSGSGVAFDLSAETTISVRMKANTGASVTNCVFTPMLRLASDTDDTYAPYQGGTFTADFGQTVYGGTLDWNTGVLTVDRAMKAFDGTEAWQTSNYGAYFYLDIDDGIVSSDVDIVKAVSSHFKGVAEVDRMNGEPVVYFMSNRSTVEFRNTGHADVTEWKAYLAAQYAAGTPVQIAYKLAAPITIQLTPQEILALDGVNTLYGDGSISITGRQRADIALISRIEALESAILNA